MYIQPIGILNKGYPAQVQRKSFVSEQQPCKLFTRPLSFRGAGELFSRHSFVVNGLNENLTQLFTPLTKTFISKDKTRIINVYNKFRNPLSPKLDMSPGEVPKLLFEDAAGYKLEVSQYSHRKQKHLELNFLQEKAEPLNIVFMNGYIANSKTPIRPLSGKEIRDLDLMDKLDEVLPVVNSSVSEFLVLVNDLFKADLGNYTRNIVKEIISKTAKVDGILSGLEIGRRGAVKRSFENYFQFPNKKVYFFKESDKIDAKRYAFIPHREGENRFFRLVEYDMHGDITDAYLLDKQNGVIKNYCPQKIFNIANISHTPKDMRCMTNEELAAAPVVKNLEKYFNILDTFETHVNSSIEKSVRVLNVEAKISDYISFNKIKQEFTNRLPLIWKNEDRAFIFTGRDGIKYTMTKTTEGDLDIINLAYDTVSGQRLIKINPENSKIFQTNLRGDILRENEGQPLYYNHYSETFKMKSRIMRSFITEAFEQNRPETDSDFSSVLLSLRDKFKEVRTFWDGVSKTKKTAVKKDYPAIIEARGDVGGLRFRIRGKDCQIGLKPHRATSDKFMRLTVYDSSGNIQKAFLIKDFTNFIHNYCSSGNYTKDAISRVPNNIVYKNEEQIKSSSLNNYINEYLTELQDFGDFIKKATIDKRFAENKELTKN